MTRSADAFAVLALALLLPGGCGPVVGAIAGPQETKTGDIAYTCKHGGGVMDGWFCDGAIGDRITLRTGEFQDGPQLTWSPYGDPLRIITLPGEWLSDGQNTPSDAVGLHPEIARQAAEQSHPPPPVPAVRLFAVQAAEAEGRLIARMSNETWWLVEAPADAEKLVAEGPFTRPELDTRLAAAPMPDLLWLVDERTYSRKQ